MRASITDLHTATAHDLAPHARVTHVTETDGARRNRPCECRWRQSSLDIQARTAQLNEHRHCSPLACQASPSVVVMMDARTESAVPDTPISASTALLREVAFNLSHYARCGYRGAGCQRDCPMASKSAPRSRFHESRWVERLHLICIRSARLRRMRCRRSIQHPSHGAAVPQLVCPCRWDAR